MRTDFELDTIILHLDHPSTNYVESRSRHISSIPLKRASKQVTMNHAFLNPLNEAGPTAPTLQHS